MRLDHPGSSLFIMLFIFNQLINVSGIRHPERTAFGWRWIAFQLLHLFSSLVILHRYCGGRKCYVCNVNPYNKTVSTGVISKRLPLLAVGRTKPQPECLAFAGGYFTGGGFKAIKNKLAPLFI